MKRIMIRRLRAILLSAWVAGASALPASAFYNPIQGRWLNRDPLGELSSQTLADNRIRRSHDGNLYCFVANNPLNTFDLLGLSEQDVTAILDQFNKTMGELCKKKKRCDCPVGALKDIHASCSSVLGCAAQADTMEGDIIALLPKFDDKWLTDHRRYLEVWPCFYHQDVKITPLDANSGDIDNIVLDTFRGCYYMARRRLVQMPDPTQSFWLYSYETKCFTCDDFKK